MSVSIPDFDYRSYDFYTGVPSSALKGFVVSIPEDKHFLATSEPEAVGMAAGAYMAGKRPCVYMQNDGIGRCITDIATLLIPYEIPVFFVIGHREDGPQHEVLGGCTADILKRIGWKHFVITDERTGYTEHPC